MLFHCFFFHNGNRYRCYPKLIMIIAASVVACRHADL